MKKFRVVRTYRFEATYDHVVEADTVEEAVKKADPYFDQLETNEKNANGVPLADFLEQEEVQEA